MVLNRLDLDLNLIILVQEGVGASPYFGIGFGLLYNFVIGRPQNPKTPLVMNGKIDYCRYK